MSPSPKTSPEQCPPVSNLTSLHQQQRNHKVQDTPQARGRNASRHELGRRDRPGARITRIYPSQLTKSPHDTKRLSSTSPPVPHSYNATTSPLLSALGATRNTAAQYTSDWTKSIPFYQTQGSPNTGGIAIASSPPTFHNSPGARDGLFAQQAMSNSPPGSRPLSHPNQYSNFGGRLQNSPRESPGRDRRTSVYSQQAVRSHSGQFGNPPLPHQPQAHFYGLPNLDLGFDNAQHQGGVAGEGGYYCGFDTLTMAGDEAARSSENIVLVGSQGGLDVFRVEKSKMDLIGRLEGLHGSVLGAKILPWTSRRDPLHASRPLIALILHGPVVKTSASSSGSGASSVVDDSASESPSRPASCLGETPNSKISGYQTSVEVYSLKEQRKIATLYKSPITPLTSPIESPMFQAPPPVGDFVVEAHGKFVAVASGASGEVFIFAPYLQVRGDYPETFRCVAKVWTTTQLRERVFHSSTSSAANGSGEESPLEKFRVPIFSLSDRWLAVSPPTSSSLYPVNGVALTSPDYERPPGLAHHSVPPQPSATCAVDAPETTSLIDRLAREGTQVAIEGARWATTKGMQAFKSYMNKGSQQNGPNVAYNQDPMQQHFPPTHGHSQVQPRQEATVVSIYDLQRLLEAEETRNKNALVPVATIPATQGCSFLSFSPSGLMLMTVSTKGDYQDIWDLKRINFRKARKTTREQLAGPHVRQVARFTRMTIAHVVDVVWSAPRMDKLAVVTDKGTVHMFSMPPSAFQWPALRRVRQPATTTNKAKDITSPTGPTGAVSSAMQALNGTARPFLDAVRARNSATGSRFSLSSLGVTPAAGKRSGKAVAAGVGKSINNIRHAGDNKLTLPPSASGFKSPSIRWLSGRGRGSVALVSGGVLQIWRVQLRAKGGDKKSATTSVTKKKLVEFALAPIYDAALPPTVADQLFPQTEDREPVQEVYGDWLPRSLPSRKQGRSGKASGPTPAPLSFSELDTNPAYQPFYTDRRVTRFVYAMQSPDMQGSGSAHQASAPSLISCLHHDDDGSPWLFGEAVESVQISSPSLGEHDSEDELVAGLTARIENKLVLRDGEEEVVEQVVVTTRRRRNRKEGVEEGEEGFFEDDCEVLDFAEDRV